LIVAVGTGLNVMTRQPLADALTSEKLAVVNIDVEQFDRIVSPPITVHGDAGKVFRRLSDLFERAAIPRRPPATLPSIRFTPTLAEPLDEQSVDSLRSDTGTEDLLQSAAIEILQDFIPRSGHIIFDAGNCAAAAIHYLRVPPEVSTTIALGMGGMGYSISGAIGAQLGSAQGSQTIVFCGDGSYLMSGMEVHTAVHYELPILYVIFNNNMHGMCVTRQQLYFDSRIECATYPEFSAALVASGLATPDRLWTGQAENGLELTDQLVSYFDGPPRPGLLELKLRREQIPPFTPFLPDDAPTEYVRADRDVSSKYRSGFNRR
jgi:acetolactate synthase-1/2/3 large subunit